MHLFINWTVLSGKILLEHDIIRFSKPCFNNYLLHTTTTTQYYRVCLNILPANAIKISNLTIDLICLLLKSLPKTFSVEILMKNC